MNTSSLKGIVPTIVLTQLPDVMSRFGIDDVLKLAHFISQCDYESEQFSAVRENLNYSAQVLLKVFPTHFDAVTAQTYARQPEKIANRAYANRMGNGDEVSGDGWNYRGRGYIQLTGKINYQALTHFLNSTPAANPDPNATPGPAASIDLIANPDLVATDYPLSSAAFFFHTNNLFAVCDRGATTDVITAVTKIINGGINGLADRITTFNKYYSLLNQGLPRPST